MGKDIQDDKDKGYYVDPEWLSKRLREYSADCKEAAAQDDDKPVIPDDLAKAIVMTVEKMSHRPNFSGYAIGGWLTEMKMDAIETLVKYLDRYDESKTNVKNPGYAYISRIIWQAFVRRIEKEKKNTAIKNKMYDTQVGANLYQHLDTHDLDDPRFYSEHDPMERHVS
jgi:hypothetical protein